MTRESWEMCDQGGDSKTVSNIFNNNLCELLDLAVIDIKQFDGMSGLRGQYILYKIKSSKKIAAHFSIYYI